MKNRASPFLLVAPGVLLLILFLLAPALSGLAMSFRRTSLSGVTEFVGLENYIRLFTEGGRFISNVKITLIYVTVVILLTIPMSYATALLITRKSLFSSFFRGMYLIPWITAPVVSTLTVRTMLDPNMGIIHFIVRAAAKQDVFILNDGSTALIVIILHSFWRSFPYIMLFLAAGISTIPREMYEAAGVDGAGKVRSFFSLTLPMTANQLGIGVLMVTIWTIQDSESVYALTQGGPGYATETIAVRLFKSSFVNFDLNMGSVLGLVLIIISLLFMSLYLKLLMRGSLYE